LAQVLSDTLAISCRKFPAWRIEQVDADAFTRLAFPVSAARMIIKAHALIGACSHVDNAEDHPPWAAPELPDALNRAGRLRSSSQVIGQIDKNWLRFAIHN
jgi:hypothetical protein